MTQKEKEIIIQNENLEEASKAVASLFQYESFKDLFMSILSKDYNINKFQKDIQSFTFESEKNNFICEKNTENEITNHKLFHKFILCKNRFDFQLAMADFLINYFIFVKNIKAIDKNEYNKINKIFDIFRIIKNNGLIKDDIQCLIDNGLFQDFYKNNFFLFLLDLRESYLRQVLTFFDFQAYILSNINTANILISTINESLINHIEQKKQINLIRRIISLLSEFFNLLENKNNTTEETTKLKIYKEKILNSLNKEKIFEVYFTSENFISHIDILLNIFLLFPNEIDKKLNFLIMKNDKQIIKALYKFILKNAQKLKNYIEEKTLLALNDIYLENNFKFHYSQYLDGKDRLINIYTRFKENEKIIKILIHNLKEINKKEQAELIENNLYNEQKENELENNNTTDDNNKYFKLPHGFNVYYISGENENCIKESLNILNKIKLTDEYLGIDSEWGTKNFYDLFQENILLNDDNIRTNNDLANIVQISGLNIGFIFDLKSIEKNDELKEKIKLFFSEKKFIGFEFKNDAYKVGEFFRNIIYKNEFIELAKIYQNKKNKKNPELKNIMLELFGKELDKRDQISDWTKRPLLQNQINYGILDAYVLILIYNKLNNI